MIPRNLFRIERRAYAKRLNYGKAKSREEKED